MSDEHQLEQAYLEGWKDAKSADRGETAADEWLLSETYAAVHAAVETELPAVKVKEELKACPFCGGTVLRTGGDDKIVGVSCLRCEACGPNHYGQHEWNDRVGTTISAEAVLAIRDALLGDSVEEAYHQLYRVVDPDFVKLKPWEEIEAEARAAVTEDIGE